jgi:uncharacterized iron-regulated membrane protein
MFIPRQAPAAPAGDTPTTGSTGDTVAQAKMCAGGTFAACTPAISESAFSNWYTPCHPGLDASVRNAELIGLVGGILGGILLLVLIGWYFWRKRRNRKAKKTTFNDAAIAANAQEVAADKAQKVTDQEVFDMLKNTAAAEAEKARAIAAISNRGK